MNVQNSKMLTAAIWRSATSLPSDGGVRVLPEIGMEASHIAANNIHCEQVLIRSDELTYRRRYCKGKWQRQEAVSAGYWRQMQS